MKIYKTEITEEELEKEMEKDYKKQKNELNLCELPLCSIKEKKANQKG
ncbi:MAG: hypothetical protein ACFFDN_24460 [Candidatus Hodarchaeota archaeon]